MRNVLYLFPQLGLSHGGIQNLNEDTLRSLAQAWPNACHRVLLYVNRVAPPVPNGVVADVRCFPCGMRSRSSAKARLTLVFAWQVLANRPDLIVVGHVGLAPLAWIARRVLGLPYVVWAHGTEVWGPHRWTHAASLRFAGRVVAVSRFTARKLKAIDATLADRTIVVNPTVRSHFRPSNGQTVRQRLGIANYRVLLSVGRLSATDRYKGFDTVLRAMPHLLARAPDFRYVVVGEGDDLPRLKALADRLDVSHATVFAGAPSDRDLPDYYNACDLFVMPSSREGFGIAFVEALACGKPVVAGRAGGARDAVLDGGLGRMVAPNDSEDLARVVLEFFDGRWPRTLTDPEHLRGACLEHFAFKAFDQRVLGVIRSLTTQPRPKEAADRP